MAIQQAINKVAESIGSGIKTATDLKLKKTAQAKLDREKSLQNDKNLLSLRLKNQQLKLRLARRQEVYKIGQEALKKQKEKIKKKKEKMEAMKNGTTNKK